jgi:hypothetical protein
LLTTLFQVGAERIHRTVRCRNIDCHITPIYSVSSRRKRPSKTDN